MPRPPRLLLSQSFYHIMARGNNRHHIYKKVDDYHYYLNLIKKYKSDHPFDLFHFCLMPNHIHFLIKTNKSTDFSTFMKKINLAYFHYYRRHYDWVGHFWQGRFKSQPVGKDEYFIQCGKYIELNPVRKNITTNPLNYKFSSYSYYAKGMKNNLITEDIFYHRLGKHDTERQKNYQEMILDDIIVKNYLKPVWGSKYQQHQERKKITYNLKMSNNSQK